MGSLPDQQRVSQPVPQCSGGPAPQLI